MIFYFELQFRRLKRWFEEMGIHPYLGFIISLMVFVLCSHYLFHKTELAKWIYPVIAVSFIFKLGDRRRNDQLRIIYNKTERIRIRILENVILAIPFLIYTLFQQLFLVALSIMLVAPLLALINVQRNLTWVIPTPFRKFPFENIVGLRKTYLFFGLLYFFIFKAIQVGNYNLGIVSFAAMFFVFMSFHFKPEQFHFVWIFNDAPRTFLKRKILASIICTSFISIPALIFLCFYFPERWLVSLTILIVGMIFLTSMILAKYSAYPDEMKLPQAILYAISLWFPPMLIIIIPIFYKHSVRKLKIILE